MTRDQELLELFRASKNKVARELLVSALTINSNQQVGNGVYARVADYIQACAEIERLTAQVGTHPKGGDGTAPALLSGAVHEVDAPIHHHTSPTTSTQGAAR
jgi:hypothetical protein